MPRDRQKRCAPWPSFAARECASPGVGVAWAEPSTCDPRITGCDEGGHSAVALSTHRLSNGCFERIGPEIHTGCPHSPPPWHPSGLRQGQCLIGDVDDDGELDSQCLGAVRSSFGGGDSALGYAVRPLECRNAFDRRLWMTTSIC